MKKAPIITTILFFFAFVQIKAQTVLLQVDKANEPKYDRGQNQKKFTYGIFKLGFVTPPSGKNAEVAYGSSVDIGFGVRKKYKIGAVYSLGWELGADYTDYKIRQNLSKAYVPGIIYESQRFDISTVSLGFYNRFNFDPHRGNFMGSFFDLGITGYYSYSFREIYKYDTNHGRATTEVGSLDYVNHFHSALIARLGYSRLSLWASYRITDFFKPAINYPELPPITAGIEIGLY
jgi:hypothetical protein